MNFTSFEGKTSQNTSPERRFSNFFEADPKKCRTVVPGGTLGGQKKLLFEMFSSWRLRGFMLDLLGPFGVPPETLLAPKVLYCRAFSSKIIKK